MVRRVTRLSRAGPLCRTGPGPDPRTWAAPPRDRRRGKRAPAAAGRAPTRRPGSARRPPLAGSGAREAEAAGVAVAGRADRGGWPSAGRLPTPAGARDVQGRARRRGGKGLLFLKASRSVSHREELLLGSDRRAFIYSTWFFFGQQMCSSCVPLFRH